MNITFDEHGTYVSPFCSPELGPLRPSCITEQERAKLLPGWAYGDHDDLPFTTTSDHRSTLGKIIPAGTACLARRQSGIITLTTRDGHVIVLDGYRWVAPAVGAPVISPEDYPELFLPA